LLETPERHGDVVFVILVDVHRARPQGACHTVGFVDVARPDARLQPIYALVGLPHHIGHIGECQHAQHGAKDFFPGDGHLRANAVKNRGLHVTPTCHRLHRLPAREQVGPFRLAQFDIAHDGVELHGVNQGTHDRLLVERVGRLICRHHGQCLVQKGLLDGGLDVEPRRGVAAFALIEKDAAHGGLDRPVQIGAIGKHNVGRLAAQLRPGPLEVALPGHDMDLLAHPRAAGKGNAVHIHVQRQWAAGFGAVTGHHVEHPGGNPRLHGQLGQAQRRQRRLFTGLEHHRVACRQRRGDLPGGHDHRVVPRNDHPHHPHGLAGDERQGGIGRGGDLVVHLVRGLAIPAQAVGRAVHVHPLGVFDGLAHVEGLGQGQLVAVSLHQLGKLDEDALAHGGRLASPTAVLEGDACGLHRGVDIGGVPTGHLRQHPSVHRRHVVKHGTAARGHTLAIDEGTAIETKRLRIERHGKPAAGAAIEVTRRPS